MRQVLNLEEVLDQRSGGCGGSAGSGSLGEGWELCSGSRSLWEESGEGVLESSAWKEQSRELASSGFVVYRRVIFTLGVSLTGSEGRIDTDDHVFTSSP